MRRLFDHRDAYGSSPIARRKTADRLTMKVAYCYETRRRTGADLAVHRRGGHPRTYACPTPDCDVEVFPKQMSRSGLCFYESADVRLSEHHACGCPYRSDTDSSGSRQDATRSEATPVPAPDRFFIPDAIEGAPEMVWPRNAPISVEQLRQLKRQALIESNSGTIGEIGRAWQMIGPHRDRYSIRIGDVAHTYASGIRPIESLSEPYREEEWDAHIVLIRGRLKPNRNRDGFFLNSVTRWVWLLVGPEQLEHDAMSSLRSLVSLAKDPTYRAIFRLFWYGEKPGDDGRLKLNAASMRRFAIQGEPSGFSSR